jgi:cathepsin L
MQLKKNINAVKFSQQQLIDCTLPNTGNIGSCDGGHPYFALNYIVNNAKVMNNYENYVYAGLKNPICLTNDLLSLVNSNKVSTDFIGEIVIGQNLSHADLYATLQKGPIAVSIDSENDAFVNYESGILNYKCNSAQPNHAVLLVGYGTDAATGKNFWLIKNTWGPKWGEKGYFRVEQTPGWNACYIYDKTISLA